MFASSSRPLVRSLAQRSARTVRQASSGAAEKPALEKATAVVDGIVKHAVRGFNLVSEKAGLSGKLSRLALSLARMLTPLPPASAFFSSFPFL